MKDRKTGVTMMRYNQRMCEQNTQNMEETMSSVRRVYVEKKPDFAVQAKDLKHEIHSYLGISEVTGVRVLIRYDVEHISDEVFEKACRTVFSEPPVDTLYRESFKTGPSDRVFSVEFLPGQFDQRADSAVQCVQFLDENAQPIIRSATTYVIEGTISDEEFDAIKHHCINPVDSRETGLQKPETLVTVFPEPEDVKIFDGFKEMPEAELKELYDSLNLAMTFKDFQHIQHYFKEEEKRDPSMTEIRVLDEELAEALKQLQEQSRNIVLMFFFLDMSDSEIGEKLNINRSTSYRHRRNSLEEIKKQLKEKKTNEE